MSRAPQRLRRLVRALVQQTEPPGRLLALGQHAAALEMPDRSLTAVVDVEHGTADAIVSFYTGLIEDNPGHHLKIVVVGGDEELRRRVFALQPRWSGARVVQAFHLDDEGRVHVGRGTRADSPVGRALTAAIDGDVVELAELAPLVRAPQPPSAEQREAWEQQRDFLARLRGRAPRVTISVLAIMVVACVLEEAFGGSTSPAVLGRMGANTSASFVGEPERLVASAFLHAGWVHLIVNGWVLWVLGAFLERLLGGARFVLVLAVSAFTGGIASALAGAGMMSVGASGAVWGLLGLTAVLAFRPREAIPPTMVPAVRRNVGINLLIAGATSFLPQVDLWAHLGGGIGGALVGLLLTLHVASTPRGVAVISRAAGVVAAIAMASLPVAIVRGQPWTLRSTPELVRHDLPYDVSIDIPAPWALVSSEEIEGMSVREFGDVRRDFGQVAVDVQPHDVPPAEFEPFLAELRQQSVPVPDGVESSDWQRATDQAWPTLVATWSTDDVAGVVAVQVRPGALVRLQVRWASDAPVGHREAAQAVLASISR